MKLYLFAPENDMALAFGGRYYTPTPVARQIACDLSLLPMWYGEGEGVCVWSAQTVEPAMQQQLDSLGITARIVATPPTDIAQAIPWGWSAYIVDKLCRAGVTKTLLPDDESIERLRNLSGRATSRTILEKLSQRGVGYCLPPLPCILRTPQEVEAYVNSQPASMLKSPWSSSGRGVGAVRGGYDAVTARSASGIIGKQGYIMGERLQEKVCDLAMEFYSDGKQVRFAGYSLFETDSRGAYQGNILATNDAIEQQLASFVTVDTLHVTRQAIESVLTPLIAPLYTGYLGIDMIVYRNETGEALLHPCIELNLRMSMGMVARIIADRYLSPRAQGSYRVVYRSNAAQLHEIDQAMSLNNPLQIVEGRIVAGYLRLTPLTDKTQYMAYVDIKNMKI